MHKYVVIFKDAALPNLELECTRYYAQTNSTEDVILYKFVRTDKENLFETTVCSVNANEVVYV